LAPASNAKPSKAAPAGKQKDTAMKAAPAAAGKKS
jgi:hypothetical protein